MMVEGSETHGGDPNEGPSARGRLTDADLLAERRARRASDTPESALVRRAEAAEATVQTLESHVASLQQRLREAEEERHSAAELIEGERAAAQERESELRRVKQREYAEQQLRVEAEDRLVGSEQQGRAEVEQLESRLGASERDARSLAERLERLERQLAEAEQSAAAERAALGRAEADLQARLIALERRAEEIERGIGAERAAREQAEAQLRGLREGNARIQGLVRDLRGVVARLGAALTAAPAEPAPQAAQAPTEHPVPAPPRRSALTASPSMARPVIQPDTQARDTEMAEALAAAVERLRARADAAPPLQADVEPEPAESARESEKKTLPGGYLTRADPPVLPQKRTVRGAASAVTQRPSHKHSESLIGRIRRWRKERRSR
jgi:chromosome segregation ATPase